VLHRGSTYDFHQLLSLLALAFIAVHMVVLLADQYLPFTVAQLFVPFTDSYRPIWVGLGIIGMYLAVLVSITFYIRRWIGQKTFRTIHYLSFIAFAATALHGLFAGTDSPLWTVQAMYAFTALSVVFLTVYRILVSAPRHRQSLAR
jgi:sulfoxide reductase heme-binding subunit YedZ